MLTRTSKRNKPSILIKCSCSHVWNYTGGSEYYATCSYCRTLVNIKENRVMERAATRSITRT